MRAALRSSCIVLVTMVLALPAWGAGPQERGGRRQATDDPGAQTQPEEPPPPDRPGRPRLPRGQREGPEELPAFRIDATIYEMLVSADRVIQLDAETLAGQGATAAEFDKALKALGVAKVLYRVDQAISNTNRDSISVEAEVPYVMAVGTGKDGGPVAQVARQKLGATVSIRGWNFVDSPARVHVAITVQLSTMMPSRVETSKDVNAPLGRNVTQTHGGLITAGQPIVLVSLDGAAMGQDPAATAYVTRIVLTPVGP